MKGKSQLFSSHTLKFSDGMTFDTSGKLRCEHRSDGWYVVGNGLLVPVASEEEGQKLIEKLNEPKH